MSKAYLLYKIVFAQFLLCALTEQIISWQVCWTCYCCIFYLYRHRLILYFRIKTEIHHAVDCVCEIVGKGLVNIKTVFCINDKYIWYSWKKVKIKQTEYVQFCLIYLIADGQIIQVQALNLVNVISYKNRQSNLNIRRHSVNEQAIPYVCHLKSQSGCSTAGSSPSDTRRPSQALNQEPVIVAAALKYQLCLPVIPWSSTTWLCLRFPVPLRHVVSLSAAASDFHFRRGGPCQITNAHNTDAFPWMF